MKKYLVVLLIIALLFTGCSNKNESNKNTANINKPDDILEEYLKNIDDYEVPTREFGQPSSYIHMEDNLQIGILYPDSDCEFLNGEITKWVYGLVEEYKKDINDDAELTISYDSYLINDSFASIIMKGSYFSNAMAHPIDIIKTFNVDLKKGEIIKIYDLLNEKKTADFENLIINEFNIEPEIVDDKLLDFGILKKEGIEIILRRGDYLPMSDGTKSKFFKYEDIKEYIKESFDYEKTELEEEKSPIDQNKTEDSEYSDVKIDETKPMIALTFDDGPSVHTDRLLDIFAKNGGKGTFFVLGNLIDSRKNTLKRIVNEGHEVGNHSWDHRQLTKLDEKDITDQIMMTQAKIYDVTGKKCKIMRPPYGSCNDLVKSVGKKLDVAFVNWSIDTLDWKTKNATAIYNEIINNVSDGDIILCHDLHKTTVDSMEKVVPKLIKDGYQLVTVSQLMSYSKKGFEAGNMYYNK